MPRRITCDNRIWIDILPDDTFCTNNGTISNGNTRHYQATLPDPYIISDEHTASCTRMPSQSFCFIPKYSERISRYPIDIMLTTKHNSYALCNRAKPSNLEGGLITST